MCISLCKFEIFNLMKFFSYSYQKKYRETTWFLIFYQKVGYFLKFFKEFPFLEDRSRKFFVVELVSQSKLFQKNVKKNFIKKKKRKEIPNLEKFKIRFFNLWKNKKKFFMFNFPENLIFFPTGYLFFKKKGQENRFFLRKFFIYINLIKIENWIKFQKLEFSMKNFFISCSKKTNKIFQTLEPKLELMRIPSFLSFKNAKKILNIGLWKRFTHIVSPFFNNFIKAGQKSINCLENYIFFLSIFLWIKFFSELQALPAFKNFFQLFKYKKRLNMRSFKLKKRINVNNFNMLSPNRKSLFSSKFQLKGREFFLSKKTYLEKNFTKPVFFPKTKIFKRFLEVFENFSAIFWEIEKMEIRFSSTDLKVLQIDNIKNCQAKRNFFILKKRILILIREIKAFFSSPLLIVESKLFKVQKNSQINSVKKFYGYKKFLRSMDQKLSLKIYQKNHREGFFRCILPIFQISFHLINFKTRQKSSVIPPEVLINFCNILSFTGSKIEEMSSSFLLINGSYGSSVEFFFNSNQLFYCSKKNFF